MTTQTTNKPNSFIFYRSFFETISDLEDKQQLEIYKAIAEFSLNDNLRDLSDLSMVATGILDVTDLLVLID